MINSNKFCLSLLFCSFFAVSSAVIAKDDNKPAKRTDQSEFKYKTSCGDFERNFVKNFFGNVKSYAFDILKNFKKHPELFVLTVGGSVTGALYKDEICKKMKEFVYGNDKNKGHKDKIVYASWIALVAAYLAKDKINKVCFADEDIEMDASKKGNE